MSLYKEQLEPYMYSEKRRKRHSYKWEKRQMNKFLRLKNKRIADDDRGGYGKKELHGWQF